LEQSIIASIIAKVTIAIDESNMAIHCLNDMFVILYLLIILFYQSITNMLVIKFKNENMFHTQAHI